LTGAPAIHEPRGTPSSVVMQALGSRAAFATPSAKLTARPTARKASFRATATSAGIPIHVEFCEK